MSMCKICPSNNGCTKDKNNCGVKNNNLNNVKKIIGVMSGKGGVGKSSISAIIAKQLNQLGYKVGVLDADITGPSIPRLLGVSGKKAIMSEDMILPVNTNDGIKVMSLNFLMENEGDPVIWRGPMISGVVEQFWKDVLWGELDYLVIDMPPGTGDVALTVMNSIPISGIVMVSVPQNLVSMIVSKAVNMARKMDINILGVIENMSYITCPDCDKKIRLFNGENTDKFLEEMNLKLLAELPMINSISNLSDGNTVDEEKNLKLVFEPIVNKIIAELEAIQK
ncbi:Mrp/NBP35 family ATP-binding protein [Paraclostridium bifermentans]|uniref:Mrp/NBP35 family ATP-binding protein n=1 Tax=Paraclostridium bifermentans TaxID=1490 RepID=UPI00038D46E4|nr:Mrp/NBP35 family ATP-binding protein [Paraclostridium bifermentans]EQK48646.1 cobQ/CobB/MinD/ParA nucleotide binding domain protein [[Clostridium] bifermentans ATCC 19299] [Paraclostridium bifermentans ATCC 19299]TQO59421.1 ATP-binding protein [Paraclostridium bifermentans]GKZ08099.1 iron-sulfur cluster carrier protein [Paraclostridium bifermentans]GKZ10562.1 iron-sulfur cluster carrier protein [Paraclostridium bifermentans]